METPPPPPAIAAQAPLSEAVGIPFVETDVDYTSVSDPYDELATCAGPEQDQERGIYVASRMDLLVRSTLLRGASRRSAAVDLEHGSYSFEPPRFRSVSSLSPSEQIALYRQMSLLCAGFLGLVTVTSRLSLIQGHELAVTVVSLVAVCMLALAIAIREQSMTSLGSWVLFVLLGVAQGEIIEAIDSTKNSPCLIVICAMSFNFLFVALYRTVSLSGFATQFSPGSLVKASAGAYLTSAAIQITVYATYGDASQVVTRNGLVGCFVAKLVLGVYHLWDFSQMRCCMTRGEVPRVPGFLYLNLVLVTMYFGFLAMCFTPYFVFRAFFCVVSCFTCETARSASNPCRDGEENTLDPVSAALSSSAATVTGTDREPILLLPPNQDASYSIGRGAQ